MKSAKAPERAVKNNNKNFLKNCTCCPKHYPASPLFSHRIFPKFIYVDVGYNGGELMPKMCEFLSSILSIFVHLNAHVPLSTDSMP